MMLNMILLSSEEKNQIKTTNQHNKNHRNTLRSTTNNNLNNNNENQQPTVIETTTTTTTTTTIKTNDGQKTLEKTTVSSKSSNHQYNVSSSCTINELQLIEKQLSRKDCNNKGPWHQKCSFTKATKCVDSSLWFHNHHRYDYQYQFYNNLNQMINNDNDMNDNINMDQISEKKKKVTIIKEIWIGMNVGCNKGFDAINMGLIISNGRINNMERSLWKKHMESKGAVTEVGCELLAQQYQPYFVVPSSSTTLSSRPIIVINPHDTTTSDNDDDDDNNGGNENEDDDDEVTTPTKRIIRTVLTQHVFCIEPVPLTYHALNYSANELDLISNQYMTITKAAIGLENIEGGFPFPAFFRDSNDANEHMKINVGVENVGLGHTNCNKKPHLCEHVPVMSLKHYYEHYVQSYIDSVIRQDKNDNYAIQKQNELKDLDIEIQYKSIIKILSIDVEGYDYDVILGGIDILNNYIVEYVEVEYNYMGSWSKQNLKDFIDISMKDYICYWSGQNLMWKITGCFLDYYQFHHWSNIACVHPIYNPSLFVRMEQLHYQTIHTPNISF